MLRVNLLSIAELTDWTIPIGRSSPSSSSHTTRQEKLHRRMKKEVDKRGDNQIRNRGEGKKRFSWRSGVKSISIRTSIDATQGLDCNLGATAVTITQPNQIGTSRYRCVCVCVPAQSRFTQSACEVMRVASLIRLFPLTRSRANGLSEEFPSLTGIPCWLNGRNFGLYI